MMQKKNYKLSSSLMKQSVFLLALTFILSLFLTVGADASPAHLNKYKKSLFVGEGFKLKVLEADKNAKITFSSSNKKVATVSSKGKVSAVKRGKAVITVKMGTTVFKCNVTVKNMRDKYRTQVRTQINSRRRAYGLTSVDNNRYLAAAAQKRAKELEDTYGHVRPNGKAFTSAISLKYNYSKYCYEIIGNGYTTPKKIVSAWMNNPDTKKPIIGKGYEDIGVGYHIGSDGTQYWCVILSAKK
ncbi:MAG: Ig-like domain-containing protein [Lachnospiraceae bacterium]|nr:Ig-like domain-containing protein [Lachnospiraceae bacterium]